MGLSGAGKTVTGRLLAERLGWSFVDLDAEVERRAGAPISRIFAENGETRFRQLEAEVTATLRPSPTTVVSAGGGWMARPELRDAWPDSILVWLQVEPAEAARRLANRPPTRPLLAGPHPRANLEALLASRLTAYGRSEYTVRTDGLDPEQVADRILVLVRDRDAEDT